MSDTGDSPRKCYRQLIVIGNGFDLECGLKSRYSDFIKKRKVYPSLQDLEKHKQTWREHINNKKLTVWDAILKGYYKEPWHGIEKAIEEWVVPGSEGKESESCFQRLLSLLNPQVSSSIDNKVRQKFSWNWRNYDAGKDAYDDAEVPVAQFILHVCQTGRRSKSLDEKWLYNYLCEEVSKLEAEFGIYLSKQLKAHKKNYYQEAKKLIEDLSTPERPLSDDPDVITKVLSFNYTDLADLEERNLKIINIHGKYIDEKSEIIFGIDGKDHLDNPLVAPFTKTYRLLGLHSEKRFSLFESAESSSDVNDSFDVIKFYGHSLSESDYSYFQAIFDEVNLYSGSTQLIFYYRNHSDSKDACTETSKSVSRLLTTYGQTMDNKDHGKNLMHKLILEGRLSVLELKRNGK